MKIGKAIKALLETNEELKERVSQIYPLVADNGTNYPFIVYKRVSITPANSKDSFIFQKEYTIDITIVSEKYSESTELADMVIDTLQGKKGLYGDSDIIDIRMVGATEEFNDAYIQTITFNIKTK